VTEKQKREVICKPDMKVSRYCSSSYINWGGSESPTPTIVLPLQAPHPTPYQYILQTFELIASSSTNEL
jgi:hypothetical protein